MSHFNTKEVVKLCIEKLSALKGFQVELVNSLVQVGGCIHQAVRITTSAGDFFLKWNASAPFGMFAREVEGLAEMASAENTDLIIPEVIWSRDADEQPGVLLLEFLQPAAGTSGMDEQLGRGIARLHQKTAAAFGFHQANYCGLTLQNNTWSASWPEFYAQRRIWALVQQIRHARQMRADELNVYERLMIRIPQLLDHQTVPSLIHGDLWSGNYLYTARGPALIDPACSYADREMELGMMLLFGGFPSRVLGAYEEAYPLPQGWKERIRLYQLYHVLNHHLLFGGSYGRQALDLAKAYL